MAAAITEVWRLPDGKPRYAEIANKTVITTMAIIPNIHIADIMMFEV